MDRDKEEEMHKEELVEKGNVEIKIALVKYGYQMDIYDYTKATKDGNGVIITSGCHDFAGDYDIARIAECIEEAMIDTMRKLEKNYLDKLDEH